MLVQGALHLLTGFDHLAFLIVLLLGVARRKDAGAPRPLRAVLGDSLKVVTAFTVAHSLTLAIAAAGAVVIASRAVEASIAATIALTALVGVWRPTALHDWPLAFAVGLVHGFGFAGALAGLLGGKADPAALGAFNLGIELAQVAIVLSGAPLLWLLARRPALDRVAAPALSMMIALAGTGWLVQRLVA